MQSCVTNTPMGWSETILKSLQKQSEQGETMTKDEALKLGLEALEGADQIDCDMQAAITAIKEVLAQPKQEPLAWISTGPATMIHWTADKPAYGDDWVPLYTTPPQRTWVGLTDEERDEICLGDESIARSIEAKLREKNGGNHGS